MELRPLVGIRFQVLFHSPNRGSFHLSLALLFTIGHQEVLSLAGWSPPIHARFHESGTTRDRYQRSSRFAYEAITLFGAAFQLLRLRSDFVTLSRLAEPHVDPTTPMLQSLPLGTASV